MIGMVILNYNDCETTVKLYKNVKEYQSINHIVIVDNCSTDDSFDRIKEACDCDVIRTERNGGYAFGNNCGINWLIDNYSVDYIVVSNPDVYFEEKFVKNIVAEMKADPKIGIMSGVMHDADGLINANPYGVFPRYIDAIKECFILTRRKKFYCEKKEIDFGQRKILVEVIWGSLFIISTKAYLSISGFDENTFLYHEENIIGKRMQEAGFSEAILTSEKFLHLHEVSISKSTNRVQRHIIRMKSMLYFQETYNSVSGIKRRFLYLLILFSIAEIKICDAIFRVIKRMAK